MSVVKNLIGDNFSLRQKQLLCSTGSNGSTLVLFKKPGCPGCNSFAPIFEQLAREHAQFGISFATVDIDKFKKVLVLAKNSDTPVNYVPFLLLYIGTAPRYKYTGAMNIVSLRNFCQQFPEMREVSSQTDAPNGSRPPQNNYRPQSSQQNNPTDLSSRSNRGRSGYMTLGGGEEEDCNQLICPTNVTPHNSPWRSEYHKMDLNLEERG
jgi:thiol-disulfide isomerase/thioredoxin